MPENIYGGSFPWSSFIGIGGSDGPSQEEKDYLDWSSFSGWGDLPGSGIGGDDYLNSFQGDFPTGIAAYIEGTDPLIDTEIDPTIEDLIASGVLTADAPGTLGSEVIDDPLEIIDDEAAGETENIRDTTYDYSGYGLDDKPIVNTDDYLSTIGGVYNTDPLIDYEKIAGITPDYRTASASLDGPQVEVDTFSGPSAGKELIDDPYGLNRDNHINLLDYLNQIPIWMRQSVIDRMPDKNREDLLNNPALSDEWKKQLDPNYNADVPRIDIINKEDLISQGHTPISDLPTDSVTDPDWEENLLAGGEGGGIRDMLPEALKGMYDKLGIGGILSLIGLLGVGGSSGGSSAQAGGVGSFVPGQRDPFGSTADYANMPGGGVGQPTYLNPTQAPIYYPFASEVTKQYNAQSPEPFSFTRGPAPDAMIQNLTPQRIPGVQYVADGAFMRRNGLTEGPGTETSDDIPAMLSDGEFVTNAEANRGIGAMALLDQGMPQEVAMDPEQQRLAGARQMYLQQAMGQQLAKKMRNS